MRTGAPATARSAYYDRNPVSIQLVFNELLNPHPQTLRASYTVPANRKAILEYSDLMIGMYPQLVTTLKRAWFSLSIQVSGGTGVIASFVELYTQVPSHDRVVHSQGGTLNAGDNIALYSEDDSTGGQCYYIGYVKLLEFDA